MENMHTDVRVLSVKSIIRSHVQSKSVGNNTQLARFSTQCQKAKRGAKGQSE